MSAGKIVQGKPILRLALVAMLGALAFALLHGGGAGAASTCDKVASPLGFDTNPGTEALPYRTAQKLADSLTAGQSGCLRAGTYAGGLTVSSGGSQGAPITIQSYPGERSVLIGRVWVQPGATYVRISDLDLVGLNPENLGSPLIEASDVTLQDNDITNVHTADCVFVGTWDTQVTRVLIKGNRIHNCGRIPTTNRHQGISVWNARGTTITENTIYDNADRGVQLYPNARGTTVSYNTIDGNGEGILISGANGFASSGNLVERNVITNSKLRDNVETYWPPGEPVGQNNVIRENCISGGVRDNGDGGVARRLTGVVLSGNLYVDPDFVNRLGKDFRLRPGSPCLSTLSGAVWRAFSDQSIWNIPASQKGTPTATNPYAAEFGGPGQELEISGIPNGGGSGITYAKPIYFAKPGDPTTTTVTLTTTWSPKDDLRWDGQPIPIPEGVAPAPGSDGHLTIVSADRRTAWDFWRATSVGPAGIVAAVITQWDLTGSGVAGAQFENSARGSGVPVIPSTVRADEALHGISHAIGITIPHVSSDYVYPPASHSDGQLGPDAPKYGQLFVLRPDYQPPAGSSIGERNIVQALKTYGAYLVDQGGSLELDADSTQPDVWAETGLGAFSLSISASDFRLIQ